MFFESLSKLHPNWISLLAFVEIRPYCWCQLLHGYDVRSHPLSPYVDILLWQLFPQLHANSKSDLVSTHYTLVEIVQVARHYSPILVMAISAGWTIPTMTQLEGNHHSLVTLSPLYYWGNGAYANHERSRKCSYFAELLFIHVVVDTRFDVPIRCYNFLSRVE